MFGLGQFVQSKDIPNKNIRYFIVNIIAVGKLHLKDNFITIECLYNKYVSLLSPMAPD